MSFMSSHKRKVSTVVVSVFALGALGAGSTAVAAAPTPAASAFHQINVGGPAVTSNGISYKADTGFVGGSAAMGTKKDVLNTIDDALYLTNRHNLSEYKLAVPNGEYDVTLKFAEVYFTKDNERVFNVSAEGNALLSNFDIHKAAGGSYRAVDKTFTVKVTDGVLNINFKNVKNQSQINAISVVPKFVPQPVYLNVGSDKSVVVDGKTYQADKFFKGGNLSTGAGSLGTPVEQLDRTTRYGMSGYAIPVDGKGKYKVTLRMLEPYHNAENARVFDVKAEGKRVLDNFDVWDKAGGKNKTVTQSFEVTTTDGVVNLDFAVLVDHAVVSSIAVEPMAGVTPLKPVTPPVTTPVTPMPEPTPEPTTPPVSAAKVSSLKQYPVSPDSVWKMRVDNAKLDPNSAQMSEHLRNSFKNLYGGVASFNVWQWNNAIYQIEGDVPRYNVKFDDCQNKGTKPSGWDAQLNPMPIPDGAEPSPGTDGALMIYSPQEDRLWELWKAKKDPKTGDWSACWGGSIKNVSKSNGQFDGFWGATATGLAGTAGALSLADMERGAVDHAVNLAIPQAAKWNNFSWPAKRSDGFNTDQFAVPEGSRLRLDPSVNVDALNLHPIAKIVAKGAQTHGLIVTDVAGTVAISPESGQTEKLLTGTDPWVKYMNGTPGYAIFKNFPWDKIQVVERDFGKAQWEASQK